jgi:hypothetical protein
MRRFALKCVIWEVLKISCGAKFGLFAPTKTACGAIFCKAPWDSSPEGVGGW